MPNPECFHNCKGIVQYTIATVFVNSIPAQSAVYQKFSCTASEIFMIIIKISVNHFYDFDKVFSRGWVGIKGSTKYSVKIELLQ